MNRDLLYECMTFMDYPEIGRWCSTNKDTYLTCSTDEQIGNLIRRKRIELRTDLLVSNPSMTDKMMYAIVTGDVEVVDELIKRGYDPSKDNNYPIILASYRGKLPIVNRLLEDKRVNPGASGSSAVIRASENDHLPVLNRLLQDKRVDPGANHNQAIIWASRFGYLRIVNRLLQHERVDPTARHNEAIRWASESATRYTYRQRCIPVVRRLLQDERVATSLSSVDFQKYLTQIGGVL